MSRNIMVAVMFCTATLAAVVVALVDWDTYHAVKSPVELTLFITVGLAFVATGITAWRTRPHDNTGRLMVIAGLLWLAKGLSFSNNSLAFTIGWMLTVAYFAVLIQVVLGFPLGRLRRGWERWFVGGCYVYYIGSAMCELLFADPGKQIEGTGKSPINLLLIRDDPDIFAALQGVFGIVDVSIGLFMVGVLVARWRAGTPAYRSAFAPLWLAGVLGTAVAVALYVINAKSPGALTHWGPYLAYPATALSPLAVVVGLWRYRVARSAVSDVMVEVGSAPLGEGFTNALRRALRDPSLVLWSWSPERGRYLDADGKPQKMPDENAPRAVTVLERDGVAVGALVHDRSLRDQPQLLAAVRSAATVAMDNQRLQAELEAQLEEVRESRGRIVAAGDAQRRRLERDLHDGAQQRLVAATILLRRAQRAPDEARMRELLTQGTNELESALVELRELARGVYPPVLQERGLGSALTSLAERAPLPVEIVDTLRARLPAPVELAAYFIAAEAVANAMKHSSATLVEIFLRCEDGRLRVVISDDGCGGATYTHGGGLSGLIDRASALGGDISLSSPPGSGTALTLTLPVQVE